jgi:hypothetical protein
LLTDVAFAQLADLVWFVETGSGYTGSAESADRALRGEG